jgi:hypothetical protein
VRNEKVLPFQAKIERQEIRQDNRMYRIFLPFLPVPLKAGKKGKKGSSPFEGGSCFLSRRNLAVRGCGKDFLLLIPGPVFPLRRNRLFTASSGSREKKYPDNPVDPPEAGKSCQKNVEGRRGPF